MRLAQLRQLDRAHGFESARGAKHERIGVARADDVKADRKAGLGEAARDRRRGLAGEVEWEGERRPVGPAGVLVGGFLPYVERRDGERGGDEEIEVAMEEVH